QPRPVGRPDVMDVLTKLCGGAHGRTGTFVSHPAPSCQPDRDKAPIPATLPLRHSPHTRRECMLKRWRPQTNIVFELVPSPDLDVDHTDPKTREELRIAYGMKDAPTFAAESTVWSDKNSGWFARHSVPGSHMTFFVVHKLISGGNPANGRGAD